MKQLFAIYMTLIVFVVYGQQNNLPKEHKLESASFSVDFDLSKYDKGDPEGLWIHWDDGTPYSALGHVDQTEWATAARFTPEDIAAFEDWKLTRVRIGIYHLPDFVDIAVWQGESEDELEEMVRQNFEPEENGWNMVHLDEPYEIDVTKELWIGAVWGDPGDGVWSPLFDAGPEEPGKGGKLVFPYPEGEWQNMEDLIFGGNWNIQGFVEGENIILFEITFHAYDHNQENLQNAKIKVFPMASDKQAQNLAGQSYRTMERHLLNKQDTVILFTDASGHASFETPPGNYTYQSEKEGYLSSHGDFTVTTQDILIEMQMPEIQFAGGQGTEENPWLIETAEHLNHVRNFLGPGHGERHFKQVANIDLDQEPWNQGEGWEPIGCSENYFFATYDGNHKVVDGMHINRISDNYQGLFGYSQGTIKNLGVVNASLNVDWGAGILVGVKWPTGLITHCHTSGSINGDDEMGRLGGLAGWCKGDIVHSHSSAKVNSTGRIVGGLSGAVSSGTIINSWATGNVTGTSSIGGLTGICQRDALISGSYATGNVESILSEKDVEVPDEQLQNKAYEMNPDPDDSFLRYPYAIAGGLSGNAVSNSQVKNSYAMGSVSASGPAGGLIGVSRTAAVIQYTYATGDVIGNQTGGLAGDVSSPADHVWSYWNVTTSDVTTSPFGIARHSLQMVHEENFNDWDFDEVWSIIPGESYPFLSWQLEPGTENFPPDTPIIEFQVTDSNDQPVTNAAITMHGVINEAGNYQFTYNPGSYEWMIAAPGYYPEYGPVDVAEDNIIIPVQLTDLATNAIVDINGNMYETITIGEQEWMAENLRVTHYQNGDPILDGAYIGNVMPDQDYFFAYDGDATLVDAYGKLYSDFVVKDDREVCPEGWQVPSQDQWKVLDVYLGMTWKQANNWGFWNGSNEGGKLKTIGTDHWLSPNKGAVDAYGFKALPGGVRSRDYFEIGKRTWFLTSSYGPDHNLIKSRGYSYNFAKSRHSSFPPGVAQSIRCIKIQTNQDIPLVSNGSAYDIEATSAKIDGEVIDDGNATVIARGVVYHTSQDPIVETELGMQYTHDGGGTGEFTAELVDLEPGMTYYARAYAVNANGMAYGETQTFTTPEADIAGVNLGMAYDIEETSFSINAEVFYEGGSEVSERGVVWEKASMPTLKDNQVVSGSGPGEFNVTIAGLEPNTRYHYRAYAINSQGTAYSRQFWINTRQDLPPPSVETVSVSDITAESVVVNGQITDHGGGPVWERGVRITGDGEVIEVIDSSTEDAFSVSVSGLQSATQYTAETYAVNDYGRVYGESIEFNTVFTSAEQAYEFLDETLNNLFYLLALYQGGGGHHDFGIKSFNLTNDLMGEDMVLHSRGYGWFRSHYAYEGHQSEVPQLSQYTWARHYLIIDMANWLLSHVDNMEGSIQQKQDIKGQALALRAYLHFHLVQVFSHAYGFDSDAPGIPYVSEFLGKNQQFSSKISKQQDPDLLMYDKTTYPKGDKQGGSGNPFLGTGILERGTVQGVYNHLQADLDESILLLNEAGMEQAQPAHIDLAIAHGLRARAALAMEDYQAAATHAQSAINAADNNNLFYAGDFPDELEIIYSDNTPIGYDFTAMRGFNTAALSPEWMWGNVITQADATIFGSFWSHMDPRSMGYAVLGGQKKITLELYDQIADTDRRRNLWMPPDKSFVGSYDGGSANIPPLTQLKFLTQQVGSFVGDCLYMRLGEMYLIRAEALARQGGLDTEAQNVLFDLISTRDTAYTLSDNTGDALIEEIMLHRKIELWGEGHGVLDIRRLQKPLNRPSGDGNHQPDLAQVFNLPANDEDFLWHIPFHHYLTFDMEGSGLVTANGDQYPDPIYVSEQTAFHMSAQPTPGYNFLYWTDQDNKVLGTSRDFTFMMPADNTTLIAHFSTDAIFIDTEAIPEQGGTVFGGGAFAQSDPVTLQANPASGYHFINWMEDETVIEGVDEVYSFTAQTNRSLVANFGTEEHTISLAVLPDNAGTVSGEGSYSHGENVSLSAQANEGYQFVSWREDGAVISSDPKHSFTAMQDRMLVAVFTVKSYEVSLETIPENNLGGTASGQGTYAHGSNVSLSAIPNLGYNFDHWEEDGEVISQDQSFDFSIEADRHLKAVFSGNTYEISTEASPAEAGNASGEGTYHEGEMVTLAAEAAEGYYFLRWVDGEDQISVTNPYSFSANTDRTLTAEFAVQWWPDDDKAVKNNQALITAEVTPENTGIVLGQGSYEEGEEVTLTASPNVGIEFTTWMEDGEILTDDQDEPIGATYSFTATENRHLVAVFDGDIHTVTVSAEPDDGGSVEVNQDGNFFQGELAMVSAHPGEGHAFKKWTLGSEGPQVSVNPEYNFTVLEERHLVAHFKELDEYLLTMESIPEDAGTLSGQGSHVSGTAVSIDAEPNAGYLFGYWIKDGGIYAYQPDTVIVIAEDLHLEGFFKRLNYEISAATDPPEGGFVTGADDYDHFEEVELQAIPNTGFQFLYWKEDGVVVLDGDEPAGESYIFVAEENRHLEAHFKLKSHEVMAYPVPKEGGAITGTGNYEHFEYTTLEASPAIGYTFSHWEEDGGTVEEDDTNLSFMVTRNRSFEAHFAIKTYDITAQPNDADFGSVTGGGTYEHFEEVTLSAIPETGYYFVEWTEDGEVVADGDEPAGAVYSFMAEEERDLVAHFAIKTYDITAQPNDADFGSVTGGGTYEHFEEVTLSASPETGYYFVEWTENDEVIMDGDEPAGETYTFMAVEDRDLVAVFALTTYLLSFHIVDAYTGYDIHDATITINGDQHEEGVYVFEELPPGVYPYQIDHEQYFEAEGEVEIVNEDVTLVVELHQDDTSVIDPEALTVNVFPNPAQNAIHVEANMLISEIHLVNMLGQRVISKTVNQVYCELNVSGLQEGVYFIQVFTKGGVKTLSIWIVR